VTFTELTVSEFFQAVAEGSPTPGGGSVSSLIAGLSSALVGMVGSLTAARLQAKRANGSSGKDKGTCCENADPKLRLMLDMVSTAGHLQTSFLVLADEDSAAYDRVITAYRLPKSTEEEKQARSLAIQDALKEACLVPAQVVKLSLEVLRLTEAMVEVRAMHQFACLFPYGSYNPGMAVTQSTYCNPTYKIQILPAFSIPHSGPGSSSQGDPDAAVCIHNVIPCQVLNFLSLQMFHNPGTRIRPWQTDSCLPPFHSPAESFSAPFLLCGL
jgi:formiminotetrahydrofolate cyclodeaminase